jgi:hypothetical protein
MRNEGPFIVEWVAWYRRLGFTDLVVVTNNCTDHSPELLDALQAAGWVHHLRRDIPPDHRITVRKLALAREHPAVRQADWVLTCDVDEFLVIHPGQGLLADLLAPQHDPDGAPRCLGMAINWQVFGTDGKTRFEDRPVHRQFFRACGRHHPLSRNVKSLFRCPKWFDALGEHGPRGLSLARAGRAWGDPGMVWITPDGRPLPEWTPDGPYLRKTAAGQVSFRVAQMNHYMLRSAETYSLKAGTLSPVGLKDRYTPRYFQAADSGEERDETALRHAGAFDAVFQAAMALPDVARLHALCCEDHRQAIVDKARSRGA